MGENSTSLPSRTKEETVVLSVVISTIMVLSVFGNLLIIIVLLKGKRLRRNFANQLVLSLSIADLITAFVPMNYQLATFVDISLITQEGFLCSIGSLLSYIVFLVSILTLVMLSVDRFLALGYPLKYNLHITVKIKIFMVAYPWIHSAIFGIFCGVSYPIKFDPVSMDCGLNWKKRHLWFIMTVLTFNFVIPFTLLSVLNLMTLRLVRYHNRILVRQVSKDRGERAAMTRKRAQSETKIAKISITIISAFLLCWTPYIVTRGLSIYCCRLPSIIHIGAILIVDLTSLLNPVIYSSLRSDLRQSIRNVFRGGRSVVRVEPLQTDRPVSISRV